MAISSFLDDVHVKPTHLDMSLVSSPITLQRQIGEHPVKWGESVIQVVVKLSKTFIKIIAYFFALQSTGCGENGDLLHDFHDIKRTPFVDVISLISLETGIVFDEMINFVLDHADVETQIFSRKTNFNEFFLLHEYLVRNIVDYLLAENRCSEMLEKV